MQCFDIVCNLLYNSFLQGIICVYISAMVCSGLSTRVQIMIFMITLPETKPQNTKTSVAPELIGICPNQPCNPSVLSLSSIINAS